MFARTKNLDVQGQPVDGTYSDNKVHRIFMKMPIISELSRRFHMLTTDAKPDPPRVGIEGYTHNLQPPKSDVDTTKSRSAPTTPEREHRYAGDTTTPTMERQKSAPNGTARADDSYTNTQDRVYENTRPLPGESRENKRPGTRTRIKPKQSKHSQGASVINYNIINSSGVKIGSRTSYICNVNQYSANNSTQQSEGHGTKSSKSRAMPEDVDSLTTCDEEITLDDMFIIKTHIGHGWRDVARRLSYSDGQIEQFEENYRHRGIDEVVYQLLLDWKQCNTKNAQIGSLVYILWACHEYDCAERLAAMRGSTL